jgi:hypothetical protein
MQLEADCCCVAVSLPAQLERAANYARIMEELTQLGSFVRLADYLVVEAIMSRAVAGLEDLLGLLTSQKQQVRVLLPWRTTEGSSAWSAVDDGIVHVIVLTNTAIDEPSSWYPMCTGTVAQLWCHINLSCRNSSCARSKVGDAQTLPVVWCRRLRSSPGPCSRPLCPLSPMRACPSRRTSALCSTS